MGGVLAEGTPKADGWDVGMTGMDGFETLDDFAADDGVGGVDEAVVAYVVEVDRSLVTRHGYSDCFIHEVRMELSLCYHSSFYVVYHTL
mmetsp:Transcript_23050/g.48393  ORF Transcript_23050/g.48393 Transcript_23050/m.48393 type:complete len:89 (-) Transcript_23050:7-273(-)